jgi:hypothetical protein
VTADERELHYYCTPCDLADIEAGVFRRFGGSLVETVKRLPVHAIVPAGSFALNERDMGTGSLFLFLVPPPDLRRVVFAGPWLDQNRSHVIEVGRCLVNRNTILGARFWYRAAEKPAEFVDWADRIFDATQESLERHGGVWLGRDAAKALRSGFRMV